jgi:hypothetical protein
MYYARKDVQDEICKFCQNREVVPRYGEGFGKRPDFLEYSSEIMLHTKNGATSFHCSEEIWQNPLEISKDMEKEQLDEIREKWDLLLDIDCKWFDYSKKAAQAIVKVLENHGVKNVGIKFSGSKGFHIIVPWEAFPKEINGELVKNMFPEIPRQIAAYLRHEAEKILPEMLPKDFYKQFKNVEIKKGIKCNNCNEIANQYKRIELYCDFCKIGETKKLRSEQDKNIKCTSCSRNFEVKDLKEVIECNKCGINSEKNPDNFSKSVEVDLFDLMGLDIVLVSSRHLFRCPYSLHEKTALASIVIDKNDIEKFNPGDADPLKVKVKSFMPKVKSNEARELFIQALDWYKENNTKKETKKSQSFTQDIKIDRSKITMPPCITKIFKGLKDGKKRALFILINYFRSLNFTEEEVKEKIKEWNKKNSPPIKEGYVKTQIYYAFRHKKIMPPNCDKYFKDFAVCSPDRLCEKIKNPLNYTIISARKQARIKKTKKSKKSG